MSLFFLIFYFNSVGRLYIRKMQNNFDIDIAARMLNALTQEGSLPSTEKIKIPSEEQKRYLRRQIDAVSIEDRKSIGEILIVNGKKSLMMWCSEGTVINLDALSDEIIEQMYDLLEYKLNKK